MIEMSFWESAQSFRHPAQILTSLFGIACDDRGNSAIQLCKGSSKKSLQISVDPLDLRYQIDGVRYELDDYAPLQNLLSDGALMLDSTTVGFHEVFLCLKAAKEIASANLSILYVEPHSYRNRKTRGVIHRRDFELTERSDKFVGVPGAVMLIKSDVRAVVVMGYEGGRLQQVFEQFPQLSINTNIVLGVPAFQAGWEMNVYANIVGEIAGNNRRTILYAGAANPLRIYYELRRVYQSKAPGERILVVPIGTKPHAVGAALFATIFDDVGLMYDNPQRRDARSEDVGTFHLFRFDFSSAVRKGPI